MARARGKLLGVGVASACAPSGGQGFEHVDLRFDPSGGVTLVCGSMDHGQGHGTTFKQVLAGKLGLGAWHTETEFTELRIYDDKDQLVFSDDFKSLDNWETPGVGQWRAENGVLHQADKARSPAMLLLKTPELKTGRVTLKARRVGGNEGFLMFFNASSIDRFLFCNYGAAGNSFSAIQDRGVPEGCAFKGGRSTPGKIEDDRWYDISLIVTRDKAEMFLDGKQVSNARMEFLPERGHVCSER